VIDFDMADEETVIKATGSISGFAGPMGLKADLILIDEEVASASNLIAGANEQDHHIKNINFKRDFDGIVGDFRNVEE
ncbi:YbaK/EbsC family protein, partial [Klebsiella pneumoniae]|uniref:YbaK/EbsC family protein n=1 Tax=Klebsiella pneumoniae TaxID=573 RepID=UPI002FC2C6C5|nr:proline--tRNA ligase [Klebsiella pneumoniae]